MRERARIFALRLAKIFFQPMLSFDTSTYASAPVDPSLQTLIATEIHRIVFYILINIIKHKPIFHILKFNFFCAIHTLRAARALNTNFLVFKLWRRLISIPLAVQKILKNWRSSSFAGCWLFRGFILFFLVSILFRSHWSYSGIVD